MAAPSFVQASTGSQDASGTFTATGTATGTIGDVVLLQIVNDGSGVINWGTLTNTNINNLAGSAGWTEIGIFNAGAAVQQRLFIGRRTSAASAPTFTASANTSGDDVYWRFYEFTNVSAGTTLDTVIENYAGDFFISQNTQDTAQSVGYDATLEKTAQSFQSTPGFPLGRVGLWVAKNNAPTDYLKVELQADSGGSPSGTTLVAYYASGASLSTTAAEVPFSLPYTIATGTTYWIVVSRTGALNTTDYYKVYYQAAGDIYGGGTKKHYATGAWVTDTNSDHYFYAYQSAKSEAATSATCSDAAVTTLGPDRLALNFVGLADDAMGLAAFAGETGGDWTLPVAIFETSTGTDATVALNTAYVYTVGPYFNSAAGNAIQGTGGTTESQAQSFQVASGTTSARVTVSVYKVNSPLDNLVVEIQSNASGSPSGTALGSASLAGASITQTGSPGGFYDFDIAVPLSASTTYWVVLKRSGARDTTNYYGVDRSSVSVYADGAAKTQSSGSWSAQTYDLSFAVGTNLGGTIDGGSDSITSIAWNTVGFALIGTTVVLDQQHYRFRNDDGNETTATWLADLDTDVN